MQPRVRAFAEQVDVLFAERVERRRHRSRTRPGPAARRRASLAPSSLAKRPSVSLPAPLRDCLFVMSIGIVVCRGTRGCLDRPGRCRVTPSMIDRTVPPAYSGQTTTRPAATRAGAVKLTMAGGSAAVGSRWQILQDPLTMTTQRERMLSGLAYDPRDAALVADRLRARRLTHAFNQAAPDDDEARQRVLAALLGRCGARVKIEPPFHCDYGTHLHIGDDVYINFNCVVLDCALVRIGDRVLVGPGVQILAATHPSRSAERRTGREFARPVTIGDDVWLGAGVDRLPRRDDRRGIGHRRGKRRRGGRALRASSPSATRAACCVRLPRIAECRMRVLYATPECAPWVKTGGLGDVAGALTRSLRDDGVDVRVLMPAYRSLRAQVDQRDAIAVLPPTAALSRGNARSRRGCPPACPRC